MMGENSCPTCGQDGDIVFALRSELAQRRANEQLIASMRDERDRSNDRYEELKRRLGDVLVRRLLDEEED